MKVHEFRLPESVNGNLLRGITVESMEDRVREVLAEEGLGELAADTVAPLDNPDLPSVRYTRRWYVADEGPVPADSVHGDPYCTRYVVADRDSAVFIFAASSVKGKPFRLDTYEDGWVLQASSFRLWDDSTGWSRNRGHSVVVNGLDLNGAHGYHHTFEYYRIGGQPIYFFERDRAIGWSHANEEYLTEYDQVIHNRCCGEKHLNPRRYRQALSFLARREGIWYQIVLTPENR